MSPAATYGVSIIGSVDALNQRLRSARQRAAALLNQALREAQQDGRQTFDSAGLSEERQLVAEAMALLLRRPEDRSAAVELARTESLHRLGKRLDVPRLSGSRSHGEPFGEPL
jgi:hypothetical protein